jgi:hypothetical protein
MTVQPEWNDQFDRWSTAPLDGGVKRQLVHKAREDNVLLGRLAQLGPDHFGAQLRLVPDHSFFFEHPCDHVPGMALVEWGRQTGIAVAHQFYDVPLTGKAFVVSELDVRFTRFAELDAPVFGVSWITEISRKRGNLRAMTFTGHYMQHQRSIGSIRGVWTILDTAVMQRLRNAG